MKKLDLKYYKNVAETQRDPEILKLELLDLIKETKREVKKLKKEIATRDDIINKLTKQ